MRSLLSLLLVLLLTVAPAWAGATVTAENTLVIEGSAWGVGWQGHRSWVVVSPSVADFYSGETLVRRRLEGEGPFELKLANPPPELQLWLVEDRDGDGPDAQDPHAAYGLTPIQPRGRERLRVSLSGALPTFADPADRAGWLAWQLDPRAGATLVALLLLWTAALAFFALRWGRLPPEDPPRSELGAGALLPRGDEAWIAFAILALAIPLWASPAVLSDGGIDLSESPYLRYLFSYGPGEGLLQLATDPSFLMSRHPLLFIALLRGLALLLPASPLILQLTLGALGLGVLWASWALTRMVAGPRSALLAMALLACSPLAVNFGASLSPHGLHLLMVATSTLFLVRGVLRDHGPSRLLWAATSGLGALLFPAHLTYFGSQLLTLLLLGWRLEPSLRRAAGRCLGWALVPFFATAAPQLIFVSLFRRPNRAEGQWVSRFGFEQLPPWDNTIQTAEMLSGLPDGWILAAPMAALLVAWGLRRLWRRSRPTAVILLGSSAGIGALMVLLTVVDHIHIDRVRWYTGHWCIGALGLSTPLLASSLSALLADGRRRWRAGGQRPAALGVGLLAVAPLIWQLVGTERLLREPGIPAAREAAALVASQLQDGDALVSGTGMPHLGLLESSLWAVGSFGSDVTQSETWRVPLELGLERDGIQRVWLFGFAEERFGRPKIDHERLLAWRERWLAERFELEERWSFPYLELSLWAREPRRRTIAPGEVIELDTPLELHRAASVELPLQPYGSLLPQVDQGLDLGWSELEQGSWSLEIDTEGELAMDCLQAQLGDCLLDGWGEAPWRGGTGACDPGAHITLSLLLLPPCERDIPIRHLKLWSGAAPGPQPSAPPGDGSSQ